MEWINGLVGGIVGFCAAVVAGLVAMYIRERKFDRRLRLGAGVFGLGAPFA